MELVEYSSGGATRILLMDCGQKKYDVAEFLDGLERERPDDYNQITALMDRTAKHGVVWNEYKTKRLKGKHASPLCEFKARGGARIFWFFDERNDAIIVCTHGFIAKNQHDHTADIDRAQDRRRLYYEHTKQDSRTGGTQRRQIGGPATEGS